MGLGRGGGPIRDLVSHSMQLPLPTVQYCSQPLKKKTIFIGSESDHWPCLSVTPSLPNCPLVNLIDVTLKCEDANSKLVEVVTVADVDAEDHVGNSLLIWELTFGHKGQLLFRL